MLVCSRFCLALALSITAFSAVASDSPLALTANELIQKAIERTQQAQLKSEASDYTYTKVTLTEVLNADGQVTERKERVYQIFFKGGTTSAKLLQVNGRPPHEAEAKIQAENELNVQKLLGKPRSKKEENREGFLTPELVARFDFELLPEKIVQGRRAYQLAFHPKTPEPPVNRLLDRLLNRISGTLCIDAEEFEIAQADISLGSEVNLLGGVIGSLKKLAFTMQRTRVAEGLWLNTFSVGDFEGRKLLDSTRIKTKSQSKNFRLVRISS